MWLLCVAKHVAASHADTPGGGRTALAAWKLRPPEEQGRKLAILSQRQPLVRVRVPTTLGRGHIRGIILFLGYGVGHLTYPRLVAWETL